MRPASATKVRDLPNKVWPVVSATALFLVLLILIAPWPDVPLNDDWQYAHVAKSLAEKGTLAVDVPVGPSVIGQAVMAVPVIRTFGFSHRALRILTVALSVLILFELAYLLSAAGVGPGVQLVALCSLVVNPLFLHLSTSFMTEIYGYSVAMLAACIWFYGRERNPVAFAVLAAVVAGFAFWIRQFSALVFPALMIADLVVAGLNRQTLRVWLIRWSPALGVWGLMVGGYFIWARATGNYSEQFSEPLGQLFRPNPSSLIVGSGIYLFYISFFFAPFLVGYLRWEKPYSRPLYIPSLMVIAAAIAWVVGDSTEHPSAGLYTSFPFLPNVLTKYGVGPLTLTDVFWENRQTRPVVPKIPWLAIEVGALVIAIAWRNVFDCLRERKNEVGVFALSFALISLAVALSIQGATFDRYHFPGVLGFTLALAAFFPLNRRVRLYRAAFLWLIPLALFSTLSLHDYFRWNQARLELVREAQQRGIRSRDLDAGYEINGWTALEVAGPSPDCGAKTRWFCATRRYGVRLEAGASDRVISARPVDSWFGSFPDLKLLDRAKVAAIR